MTRRSWLTSPTILERSGLAAQGSWGCRASSAKSIWSSAASRRYSRQMVGSWPHRPPRSASTCGPARHRERFRMPSRPPQCATVLTAVEIVRSAEGEVLRQKLRGVVQFLRETLTSDGSWPASASRDRLYRCSWDERGWGGSRRPCVSTGACSRIWSNTRPFRLGRVGSACKSWRHTRPRRRRWPPRSSGGRIGSPRSSLRIPRVREPPANSLWQKWGQAPFPIIDTYENGA